MQVVIPGKPETKWPAPLASFRVAGSTLMPCMGLWLKSVPQWMLSLCFARRGCSGALKCRVTGPSLGKWQAGSGFGLYRGQIWTWVSPFPVFYVNNFCNAFCDIWPALAVLLWSQYFTWSSWKHRKVVEKVVCALEFRDYKEQTSGSLNLNPIQHQLRSILLHK